VLAEHVVAGLVGADVGHEQHDLGLEQAGARLRDDRAAERVVRRVQARRVDERDLQRRRLLRVHAEDAGARRLRLGRRDRQLLAEQRVEQRGLADVGAADDRAAAAARLGLLIGLGP
jgi:hypothetical protein